MTTSFKAAPVLALASVLSLAACQTATSPEAPVDWKISWTPTQTNEDNTPLTSKPAYEVEMAQGEGGKGPWSTVWSGTTTTAIIKAPPGHRCFRAKSVEKGVRSDASEVICGDK